MSRSPLEQAAQSAQRRIFFARLLTDLGRTAAPIFIALAALLVGARLLGIAPLFRGPVRDLGPALGAVALWALALSVLARLVRPSLEGALAVWDGRAGRDEALLSGFALRAEAGPGARLHVERATRAASEELPRLKEQLPLSFRHRAWVLPILFCALAATGLLEREVTALEEGLQGEARAEAARLADEIKEERDRLKDLEGLDEEEKERAKALADKLESTEDKLAKGEDRERDLLKELERRAREAEELAKELGASEEALSSALLAELERHADTAALAGALREDDFEKAADEAEALGKKLSADDLTIEARDRVREAFKRGLEKASPKDLETALGRRLMPATRHLEQGEPKPAGAELEDLARHYRQLARRRAAEERLNRLARRLRQRGQQLAGGQQSGVQRLRSRSLQGLSRVGQQPTGPLPPWTGQPQGLAGQPSGLVGPMGAGTPTPGAMPGTGMPSGVPVPGMGGQGMPGGAGGAPIPGTGAGSGMGMGAGQGQGAGAGSGPVPGAGAGAGGHQAGVGTAGMGGAATQPLGPTRTESVGARPAGEGAAELRAVEGQERREAASREARALAIQALRAEEEAIGQEPIPLTRREEVLRYFTAIRRELEDE